MRLTSLRRAVLRRIPLAVAFASCASDPTGLGSRVQLLAGAEEKWKAAAYSNYSFKSTIDCFCRDTYRGPMLVTVRLDRVIAVVDVATGEARPLDDRQPIDSLFAIVRTELRERPDLLTAAFDRKLGFPTLISYGDRAVDGGGVISVSEVVAIP
jgi:hypothetical protein